MSAKEKDSETEFGRAFSEALDRHRLTQSDVATRLQATQPYVSALSSGRTKATARTVDKVADALGADQAERVRLHRAAARDAGFQLDLPDDF